MRNSPANPESLIPADLSSAAVSRAKPSTCRALRLAPKNYLAMEVLADLYKEGAADNPITKREAVDLLKDAFRLEPDPDRRLMIQGTLQDLDR